MFEIDGRVMDSREDPQSTDSQAALVALLRAQVNGLSWGEIGDRVLERGSALALWREGDEALVADPRRLGALEQAAADINAWRQRGYQFLSVLDSRYPARLRDIHQAPPFVFACGELRSRDLR